MNTLICPRLHCRTVMQGLTDGHGRVVFGCPNCARKARGLCRDCPAPTPCRRAIRCRACARRVTRENNRRYDRLRYSEQHDHRLRQAAAYRAAHREERRLAEARRRAAQVIDDRDRLYWRERQRQYRADPVTRARRNAVERRRRARVKRNRLEVAA